MITNQVFLKASTSPKADECLTPQYAVLPIVPYLQAKQYNTIWCPFDKDDSYFVRVLQFYKFTVLYSHIDTGGDFFTYTPPQDFDCIVSNPPFSKKVAIITRLYALNKPFMMLLPQTSLQHKKLTNMFIKNGIEYLGFDNRIGFYTKQNLNQVTTHNFFASGYFCHDVLPTALKLQHLELKKESYFDPVE